MFDFISCVCVYKGIFQQAICCFHTPKTFSRNFKELEKDFLGVSFYTGLLGEWDSPHSLILNIFTIWTEWATTPNVCVIYPDNLIYLPVQFDALCPVLSRVLLNFNTKCLIMPHAALRTALVGCFWGSNA